MGNLKCKDIIIICLFCSRERDDKRYGQDDDAEVGGEAAPLPDMDIDPDLPTREISKRSSIRESVTSAPTHAIHIDDAVSISSSLTMDLHSFKLEDISAGESSQASFSHQAESKKGFNETTLLLKDSTFMHVASNTSSSTAMSSLNSPVTAQWYEEEKEISLLKNNEVTHNILPDDSKITHVAAYTGVSILKPSSLEHTNICAVQSRSPPATHKSDKIYKSEADDSYQIDPLPEFTTKPKSDFPHLSTQSGACNKMNTEDGETDFRLHVANSCKSKQSDANDGSKSNQLLPQFTVDNKLETARGDSFSLSMNLSCFDTSAYGQSFSGDPASLPQFYQKDLEHQLLVTSQVASMAKAENQFTTSTASPTFSRYTPMNTGTPTMASHQLSPSIQSNLLIPQKETVLDRSSKTIRTGLITAVGSTGSWLTGEHPSSTVVSSSQSKMKTSFVKKTNEMNEANDVKEQKDPSENQYQV